jgi:hypothetical protein
LGYLFWLYGADVHLRITPAYETSVPDLAPFFRASSPQTKAKAASPKKVQAEPLSPIILRGDSLYPALATTDAVDTTAQRILLMGDSMGEALYFPFLNICKWSNFYFKVVCIKGTTSLYWAGADTLEHAIRTFKPTLVLFTCGANEITIPRLRVRKKMYQKVISRFDSLPYIWVGTPVWTGDTVYGKMMAELVPKDQLFISQGIPMSLQPDGAHPDRAGARVWADSLARWMVYHSKYPVYWHYRRPAGFRPKIKNGSPFFNALPKAVTSRLKASGTGVDTFPVAPKTLSKDTLGH